MLKKSGIILIKAKQLYSVLRFSMVFVSVSLITLPTIVLGASSEYDEALSFKDLAMTELHKFEAKPNDYIKDYTPSPPEKILDEHNIDVAAQKKGYSDETANTIRNNFDKRAPYTITDKDLSKSKLLIDNSENIVSGISNEYVDCKQVKNCKSEYSNNIDYCISAPPAKDYQCNKIRNVDVVIPDEIVKTVKFELTTTAKYGGTYHYNLRTKTMEYASDFISSLTQIGDIDNIQCTNYFGAIVTYQYAPNTFTYDVAISASLIGDCTNPVLQVVINQTGNYQKYKYKLRGIEINLKFASKGSPVLTDSFTTNCPELNKRLMSGMCSEAKSVCMEPGDTRIINGQNVTRDCWRYNSNYICGVKQSSATNHCKSYQDNKCLQVSAECSNFKDGMCTEQRNGYKCITSQCSDSTNIDCGDSAKILCFDGSCVEQTSMPPSDFNDSLSKLAVVGQAVKNLPKDFNEDSKFIFEGKGMKCRKSGYGFSDCCKNKGWGQDLELAKCTDEEKELGVKKEQGRAIFVNRYEHDKSDRRDDVYCVFDSKIAKIIQEQGRRGQLGISFGAGKYPDCSGISPNQLAVIKLDKVDLSFVFEEVAGNVKIQDSNTIQEKYNAGIEKYYKDMAVNHD
ncbi:MAG: conjugal transfer protein TraN [Rickettsiaceae bacterium]|nr:conjugal transfer protein TraN [Rickettsiaceae bacterium]